MGLSRKAFPKHSSSSHSALSIGGNHHAYNEYQPFYDDGQSAPIPFESLDVRAVFAVEENEFLRDKTMQYMTFGLAGKKLISEGR